MNNLLRNAPIGNAGNVPLLGQPKIKMMFQVSAKKLRPEAKLPTYGSEQAAGADLYACLGNDLTIPPGERVIVRCGFAIALADGLEAQVRPRSGLAAKYGITVLNAPGTIDSDYRGEIMVTLINHGRESFTVKHHDRIAQMVIAPVLQTKFVEVETLDETIRGANGIGSTGGFGSFRA